MLYTQQNLDAMAKMSQHLPSDAARSSAHYLGERISQELMRSSLVLLQYDYETSCDIIESALASTLAGIQAARKQR
jgi:hypothetical protein